MNDLAKLINAIRHSSFRSFVDDCVLFKAIKNVSDCEGLQGAMISVIYRTGAQSGNFD